MNNFLKNGVAPGKPGISVAFYGCVWTGGNGPAAVSITRTCRAKVNYARARGLGGVMIWDLSQDHTASTHAPLLEAVKQAVATPGATSLQRSGNDLNLSFTSIPLGSYQAQWSANPAGS